MTALLGVTHSPLSAPLPPGACDCHTHVFGPGYPYAATRVYTPPDATTADIVEHQRILGLSRVVIVQPSPYGTDNACTLDAVAAIGPSARAVAVIEPTMTLQDLRALHERGVRGIRLNLETAGQSDPAVAIAMLKHAADQVAPLGWHVQLYTILPVIAALHATVQALAVSVVIDHFGRAMARDGTQQPGFDAMLDLVKAGHAYVKLSAAHRIAPDPDDAAPIARALIAANPARLVWGSDWPHPGGTPDTRRFEAVQPYTPTDDGAALNRLRSWVDEDATWHAILVDNPARLYGFP